MASNSNAPSVILRRQPNMRPFEDETLCKAYVLATNDAINGINQTGRTFWKQIYDLYHASAGINVMRTQASLQSRYTTIQAQVMLYVSCVAEAYREHGSGTNELNWINNARIAFQQANHDKPFSFDNCYEILKSLPKFDIATTRINTHTNFSQGDYTSSQDTNFSPIGQVNLESDSPTDLEGSSSRPLGRKGEKQRQKRKQAYGNMAAQAAMAENYEKFNQQYATGIADTKEAGLQVQAQMSQLIHLREVENARNARLADDQFLTMNTAHMTQEQKAFYEMRFNEIMYSRSLESQGFSGSNVHPRQ